MRTNSTAPANTSIYSEFGTLGKAFRWLDEHPKTANLLLWLQGLALAYAVYNYEFTTAL